MRAPRALSTKKGKERTVQEAYGTFVPHASRYFPFSESARADLPGFAPRRKRTTRAWGCYLVCKLSPPVTETSAA